MLGNLDCLKDGKILVALSGGADSVALLCLLHEQGCDLEALHCNFHLRGKESDRDEQFCTTLCQKRGIPIHVRHFPTADYARQHGISIEMAARQLRYQWFEEQRVALHARYIAVAHHRDDQAETVLLNLIRGTGLRGLAGMLPVNGHILRPLLSLSKSDILHYLEERGQDFVTDSTNLERDAQRNRLRLDVIPLLRQLNPQAVEHIAQAASRVADALPYYMKGIEQSDELTPTTLHEQLRGCGFTAAQEQQIWSGIHGTPGAVFETSTHRLLCNRGHFVLQAKEQAGTACPPILETRILDTDSPLAFLHTQPLTPGFAYLDADKATLPLHLRHSRQGDRFQPFGMKRGTRLLSDFLTDLKCSLFEKQEQWLACTPDDAIVWVCGRRIDHRYRVTADTRRILVLTLGA